MFTAGSAECDRLLEKHPYLIGDIATIFKQKHKVKLLLSTWVDVFCEDTKNIKSIDLVERRIPIYNTTTPKIANSMLYSIEEIE